MSSTITLENRIHFDSSRPVMLIGGMNAIMDEDAIFAIPIKDLRSYLEQMKAVDEAVKGFAG